MSASSRRTLDVDVITLRQVFIRGSNNSNIPSSSVLVSDGIGGTYWSLISTVGTYPSFNRIVIESNRYSATPGSNTFTFLAGPGIGYNDGGPGNNTSYIYGKSFQNLEVPGISTLSAFTDGRVTSNLTFSSLGGLHLSTDTTSNILWFNAGIKNLAVFSNSPAFAPDPAQKKVLPITLQYSTFQFVGLNDIQLQTDETSNSVFFGISTFTSEGFLAISTQAFSLPSTILGTASTLLVSKVEYSTGISTLSTSLGRQLESFSTLYDFQNISTTTVSTLSTFSSVTAITLSTLSANSYFSYSTLSTQTFQSISTLSSYFYEVNQSTISSFIYTNLASTTAGWSTLFTSSLGPYFSTLSSFQGGVSTLELLSVSYFFLSSISTLISSVYVSTVESLSTMSTTMTSSFTSLFSPKPNIFSTLLYSGTRGDNIPFAYPESGGSVIPPYTVTLSTAVLNFSYVVSSMRSERTTVLLDYNPVLLFPMAKSNTTPPQEIKTYLLYQDGIQYGSEIFTDYFNYNQYAGDTASPTTSNIYSRNITLQLNTSFIRNNGVSNYTLYHESPVLASNIYFLGPAGCNSTLHIRTPVRNSLFLRILNQD